jgi:hypothetical protein
MDNYKSHKGALVGVCFYPMYCATWSLQSGRLVHETKHRPAAVELGAKQSQKELWGSHIIYVSQQLGIATLRCHCMARKLHIRLVRRFYIRLGGWIWRSLT